MPYAEVIFETGSKSVVSYEDESELKAFLAEHDRRARNGEPGAPQEQYGRNDVDAADFTNMPSLDAMKSRPAERVSKVLTYKEHPADLHETGVPVDTVRELVSGMADNEGNIDHEQLIRALRDEVSPVYPQDQGRLQSMYKADADGELDLSFLDSSSAGGSFTGGDE